MFNSGWLYTTVKWILFTSTGAQTSDKYCETGHFAREYPNQSPQRRERGLFVLRNIVLTMLEFSVCPCTTKMPSVQSMLGYQRPQT